MIAVKLFEATVLCIFIVYVITVVWANCGDDEGFTDEGGADDS
jgi:hypothetical protein